MERKNEAEKQEEDKQEREEIAAAHCRCARRANCLARNSIHR
jgi:hypothetical protein